MTTLVLSLFISSVANAQIFFGDPYPTCTLAPGASQLSIAGSDTRTCGPREQAALVKITDSNGPADCGNIQTAVGGGSSALLVMWDASINGSLGGWICTPTSGLPVSDTSSIAKRSVDPSAQFRFDLGAIPADTVRVLTIPNSDIDLGDVQATRVRSLDIPGLTTAGQIAIDDTGDVINITTSVLNIHDGTDELFLFGAEAYPTSDNQIQKYDLANTKLVWEPDEGHALQIAGVGLPQRPTLNLKGNVVLCEDVATVPGSEYTECTFGLQSPVGETAYVVVDSEAGPGLDNNTAMFPTANIIGWNEINVDTVSTMINAPCADATPCFIGKDATYPKFPGADGSEIRLNSLFGDWAEPSTVNSHARGNDDFSGWDDYENSQAGSASYSSILGGDDVQLNAQLSTSIGCRHCWIGPLNAASGHNAVGPGGANAIFGEVQFGFVLSGQYNTLVGPWAPGGPSAVNAGVYPNAVVAGNAIVSGQGNKIDMAGITHSIGDNVIGGGAVNLIAHGAKFDLSPIARPVYATGVIEPHVDAPAGWGDIIGDPIRVEFGVGNSTIVGGARNTIVNNHLSNHLLGATILGGDTNAIIGLEGEATPNMSTVKGNQGIAWMPNQHVQGGGQGYGPTDYGVGAIQEFDILLRGTQTSGTGYSGIYPSTSGAAPKLMYAGIYTLSGTLSCQLDTNPGAPGTNEQDFSVLSLPTKLKTWELDSVMMWSGGAAQPVFISEHWRTEAAAIPVAFVPTISLPLNPTMEYPGPIDTNTWDAKIVGGSDGAWSVQVAPLADADPLFCQANMTVVQSRQNTTPPKETITVVVAGTGAAGGNIRSDIVGINCGTGGGQTGTNCTNDYSNYTIGGPGATVVTLRVHENSTTTFAGWSGDCNGTPGLTDVCVVDMGGPHSQSNPKSVTATFTP